ncbi:MAG: carboxypeptidase-like regulatory domain-containing protein, partial [Bacteroidota bacterium]
MKRLFVILLIFQAPFIIKAQNLTQVIRGTVIDKNVKNELIGATVTLPSTSPMLGTVTDVNGNFRIDNVLAGTYTVRVSYIGYKPLDIPNVQVNTGKETVLTIELEENIIQGNEIIVTADKRKDQPLNELSNVSARTFSVEETQRYAAAVNDPGRMVTSFAGVVSTDDGNNKISIRGNSPNGLLWRMEGIDIPNPNHFSGVGTSGGGISILSAQLLSNSDFISGAFAAEYGNALSGVFDLKLRKGNNEKNEFTAQAS